MLNNPVKEQLKAGKNSFGVWSSIGHPDVAELLAECGYDWILFDMEHGPLTIQTVHQLMQAMGSSRCVPMVRVPSHDPTTIAQVLDCGAMGVMVPKVQNGEEARRIVQASKYPPVGQRGIGARRAAKYGDTFTEYVESANDHVMVIAQIESRQGVENIDEIVSTEGIDAVAIGPGDLSADMGCFTERDRPDFQKAIADVLDACKRHDCVPCMAYVGSPEKSFPLLEQGFRMLGVGEDIQLLQQMARANSAALRSGLPSGSH